MTILSVSSVSSELCAHLSFYLSINLFFYPSTFYLHSYLFIIYLTIFQSIFLSFYLYIYLSIYISQDLTFSAEGEADVIVQLHESELAEKRRMAKESEEAEEEDRRGGSYGRAVKRRI